jgi:methionine-rich copper-binding protein CopC
MTLLIQSLRLALVALFTSSAHIHLMRSQPSANDTVATAPSALRFWFSERPELAVTTIKLTSAAGAAVPLAPLTVDTGDNAPLVATIRGGIAPGTYSVMWRTTATDGHPASGHFDFVVASH